MERYEEPLMKHLNVLLKQKHSNNFIVDIGSSYNSHFLGFNLLRGVLFDMDAVKMMRAPVRPLYENSVKQITPENVVEVLHSFDTPEDFFALSLDIDSYDLFVLINLLKEFKPSIIISEINEIIPYPVMFSVKYDSKFRWKVDHFYGYSINCLNLILSHFGYSLYNVPFNNVILIKDDKKSNINEMYKDGYVNANERKDIFTWNADVEHWQSISDTNKLENTIKEFFKKYEGKYVIGNTCEDLINEYLNK